MHKTRLPRLEIVPLRSLILHEDVEGHRVDRIMGRFRAERRLANPPIVGTTGNLRRMIVLDGASRVTAARRLGFLHFLVQIVPYPSSEIGLTPWHHLVAGMRLETLHDLAVRIPGVEAEPAPWPEARRALLERKVLACLRGPGRKPVLLRVRRSTGRFHPMRELTRIYAADPGLHRLSEDEIGIPEEWMGEERVVVLFPAFRQEDIVRFALRLDERLPMGITHHTVPNRALRVLYPMTELRSREPLAAKRRALRRFLDDLWERGRIRHYPEGSTLYDE